MINFIDNNVFIVLFVSYVILLFKNCTGNICSYEFHFQNGTRSKTAYGCGFHLLGPFWAHQFYFLFQAMIKLL